MADYDYQVVFHNDNGLPKDDYVNTLHFSINLPDTREGVADELATKFQAFEPYYPNMLNGFTVKVYEPGLNPGGPILSKSYTLSPSSGSGPPEVAVCLSYATEDNPDASGSRSRGRIYLGPLSADQTDTVRPAPDLRDAVLDLGEGIAQVGSAGNTTWMMYSKMDSQYKKIESIWCDDAWDTQRRRGLDPTSREVRDVQ
jgi:hypothetical protein